MAGDTRQVRGHQSQQVRELRGVLEAYSRAAGEHGLHVYDEGPHQNRLLDLEEDDAAAMRL